MALSMSVSAGRHSDRHNLDREYRATLDNVDPALTKDNVVLADESIADAYGRLFGKALTAYNERQGVRHPERCIEDYYAKVDAAWRADQAKVAAKAKGRGNVPQTSYEYVIQIGNHETWQSVPRDTLTAIYRETFERLRDATAGAIDWHQAVIHYDEPSGSGHLHIDGIAYGTGNKRGLETQVSMRQALKTLGLQRLPDLQELIMRTLEGVAHQHGVERDVLGCDRRHLDVAAYKQAQRDVAAMVDRLETKTAQVAEVEARLESLQRQVSAAEPAKESFAESARYLGEHRGDGGRAAELEREVEAARSRAAELERAAEAGRVRVQLIEQRNRADRRRLEGLRERLRAAQEALARLGRVFAQTMSRVAVNRLSWPRVSPGYARWARTVACESLERGVVQRGDAHDVVVGR